MPVIRSREAVPDPAKATHTPQQIVNLLQTHFPAVHGLTRAEAAENLKGFMAGLKVMNVIDDFIVMLQPTMTTFDIAFKIPGPKVNFYLLSIQIK